MSQVATASSNTSQTSGANALLSLVASQSSQKDTSGTSVADQFKALLQQLGQNQNGQANLTPKQLAELLAKQQNGTVTTGTDASQLQLKIKALLDQNSADSANADDPSAALIAEIAGLMQKFPALQQLFTGNVNADQLSSQLKGISDALAKGGNNPDFSGLQLPDDLKSQLTTLAQDPKASAALQDAASQIAADPKLASEIPQALQNFAAMMSQKNLNSSLAAAAQDDQDQSDDATARMSASDKSGSGKTRPQGLLKSLNAEQQATTETSKAEVQTVAADNKTDSNSNAFQSATPSSAKISAATDEENTTQSFFTLAPVSGSTNLTAEQTNALMLNGKSNVSLGGVADAAYTAQQISNSTVANPAAMQVAIQLQRNAQTNNNNFTMQLHPEELGRIDVSLKFAGGKVTAKISADKQETLDSLKQDSDSLTRALNSAGLQTDAGSLEFSLGNSSQQFANKSQNNNGNDNQFGTLLATDTTDETSITNAGGSQWLTLGTGRVDVKL